MKGNCGRKRGGDKMEKPESNAQKEPLKFGQSSWLVEFMASMRKLVEPCPIGKCTSCGRTTHILPWGRCLDCDLDARKAEFVARMRAEFALKNKR